MRRPATKMIQKGCQPRAQKWGQELNANTTEIGQIEARGAKTNATAQPAFKARKKK